MGVYFILRDLLKERKIEEKPFAKKIQVRHGTLYDICNNRIERVPVHVIAKICKELKAQPGDWIKYRTEEGETTEANSQIQ